MKLPRKLVILALAAILTGLVALASLSEGGPTSEWDTCDTYVTEKLAATVCQWPGAGLTLDARKVMTTLTMTADAFAVEEFTRVLIVVPGNGALGTSFYGFYDTASRTIWISEAGVKSGDRIYYTISHEIGHYLLDGRGMPLRQHHCLIYNGPEMRAIEKMVELWIKGDLGISPFTRMGACSSDE